MTWNPEALIEERRKPKEKQDIKKVSPELEFRTEFEKDYDRILFSAPVRRLVDKTQVFPLDKNDSIRNRLTHSHEVANLAKSIGTALISKKIFKLEATRTVVPILGTIGLAHDLGNPPFGHQGEVSIRSWFKKRKVLEEGELSNPQKLDFLKFDGNAQTFRLVTKLQIISDEYGLNLTKETLASMLKYTVASDQTNDNNAASKKHGFFQSEADVVSDVFKTIGIKNGQRHPLTLIMEACDDIAYSIIDIEDSVKKGFLSFSDVITELEALGDALATEVCGKAREHHREHLSHKLAPSELEDISMQMFRVHAIFAMVTSVVESFEKNKTDIFNFNLTKSLMSASTAHKMCKKLKDVALDHSFKHPEVTSLELRGHNVIHELMDMLWAGIVNRNDEKVIEGSAEKLSEGEVLRKSKRTDPFSAFAYSCISENYKRIFVSEKNTMPLRYKEAQLLTDMMSGMTDSYAIALHGKLKSLLGPDDFEKFKPLKE